MRKLKPGHGNSHITLVGAAMSLMPPLDLQEFDFESLHKTMLENGKIYMDLSGELKRMGSKPPKSNKALVHRLFDIGITINTQVLHTMQESGLIRFSFNECEILYEIEALNVS